ncbi:YbaB/EbfC family nucleoid-associated protein [Mycoplasmoides pneumoniae]|uniref:YbaB/EbfC family nucleoid-associated protein n=1 Tax=Mycoplasmoides pneumoniae TaxID=2104 RepID=UPI0013308D72|nr:YbaB/EbfC family nucleoid-associated protein [Mycoplasmoides pneumoniae]
MSFKKITEMMRQAERQSKQKALDFEQKLFEYRYKNAAIKIIIFGNLTIKSITIDPALIDPEDKVTLEEMITEAVNEAVGDVKAKYDQLMEEAMPQMPGLF